jgi:putative membrane protein
MTNGHGQGSGIMTDRMATVISLILSGVIVAFLVWLIYFKPSGEALTGGALYLPPMIAACNALATVFIINGIIQIKAGRGRAHAISMIIALSCSALFLALYVTKYYLVGDTKFLGEGLLRVAYLFILFSHIILSVVMLPLILLSVYYASVRRWVTHRRISRWTYPIWLYVSVTGVVVFFFLSFLQPAG